VERHAKRDSAVFAAAAPQASGAGPDVSLASCSAKVRAFAESALKYATLITPIVKQGLTQAQHLFGYRSCVHEKMGTEEVRYRASPIRITKDEYADERDGDIRSLCSARRIRERAHGPLIRPADIAYTGFQAIHTIHEPAYRFGRGFAAW